MTFGRDLALSQIVHEPTAVKRTAFYELERSTKAGFQAISPFEYAADWGRTGPQPGSPDHGSSSGSRRRIGCTNRLDDHAAGICRRRFRRLCKTTKFETQACSVRCRQYIPQESARCALRGCKPWVWRHHGMSALSFTPPPNARYNAVALARSSRRTSSNACWAA